jgi:hypothetical protein
LLPTKMTFWFLHVLLSLICAATRTARDRLPDRQFDLKIPSVMTLHYLTQDLGSMSLIHTCQLCHANSFDRLVLIQWQSVRHWLQPLSPIHRRRKSIFDPHIGNELLHSARPGYLLGSFRRTPV